MPESIPLADPILSLRGLRTSVTDEGKTFDVVRGVSIDLYPSEVLCLVGESGCGKTLTALSIMDLLPDPPVRIRAGEIVYRGRDLTKLKPKEMREIRSDEISMIFQDPLTSLDPVFNIGHLIMETIQSHRDVSAETAREMGITAFREVGLPDPEGRFNAYAHQLSGGMRQRVMIALALVLDPDILIADEPTTALDVTVQAQILDLLLSEQSGRQMSMILITHDLAVVAQVADRVAVMYGGEIVEEAPVDELFSDPKHPYTQGLIRALPHVNFHREKLQSISGLVPPPQLMPPGCYFAPRCPFALEVCWEKHPAHESHNGAKFRCFNPQPFKT